MAPYIYARKNGIHIIDIRETIRGLLRAKKYLAQVAAQGSLVLFVGTKKQGGPAVEREATRCHMPFVAERWLGGCLTNFRTIRSRLSRLEEVEKIRGGEAKRRQASSARVGRCRRRRSEGRQRLAGARTEKQKPIVERIHGRNYCGARAPIARRNWVADDGLQAGADGSHGR